MHYLNEKLIKYRDFINIITILLLLLLPLPNGKFTLLFFMAILIFLYQFPICLNDFDFFIMWDTVLYAILAVIYIILSVKIVLHSLHIIKKSLSDEMEITFSIFISLAGLYSLHAIIKHPNMSSVIMFTLFLIFHVLRWVTQFKKCKSG